jgi:hypothetical protein
MPDTNPFADINALTDNVNNGKSDFADLDNDGDYDMMVSEYYYSYEYSSGSSWIRYFKNTGDAQNPAFTEQFGADHPLATTGHNFPLQQFTLYPRFVDFDNDGDIDVAIGEGGTDDEAYGNNGSNEFHLIENYGTVSSPYLYKHGNVVPQFENALDPSPAFFDYDDDGDIDLFQGDASGNIHYFTNENPAAVTTIDETPIEIAEAEGSVQIDNSVLIADSDFDEISKAVIQITNFHVNDTLTFNPNPPIDESANISYVFDDATGTLTITGRASTTYYALMLRSLIYYFNQPGYVQSMMAMMSTSDNLPQLQTVNKTIRYQVFDTDLTASVVRIKPIAIGTAFTPPSIDNYGVSGKAGKIITLDLNPIIQDNQDTDANLTVTVEDTPPSGAIASINSSKILTIDYTGLSFTGLEDINIRVTDTDGYYAIDTIDIDITNVAPIWSAPTPQSVVAGGSITIDLTTLYSDADDNLVTSSLNVSTDPSSGAPANLVGNDLSVDYTGLSFTGADVVSVQVCDIAGACATSDITITVTNVKPTFAPGTEIAIAGGSTSVDLSTLFSDTDGNIDPSSLAIKVQPTSGADATLTGTDLLINYAGQSFTGSDKVTVEICDVAGECETSDITITVTNTSPVFSAGSGTVVAGKNTTVDLSGLFSDADDNLVPSTLKVKSAPSSNADAAIVGADLQLDYNGIAFSGNDIIQVEICDIALACATSNITIDVTNNAPQVIDGSSSAVAGKSVSYDLLPLISDVDDNLVLTTLKIIGSSTSGAVATIAPNSHLDVNYSGVVFAGADVYTIEVCDIAGACTQNEVTIDVTNTAPVLTNETQTVPFGGIVSINLESHITDIDNNINFLSLRVVQQPASGADASIDANNNLVVNYAETTFASTENIEVEVCDLGGSCVQNTFAISVNNAAPIFSQDIVAIQNNLQYTIDLLAFTSDFDNNLDPNSFAVVVQPSSGASAEIVDGELIINYDGITRSGTDQLTIRVCDFAGACAERVITIDVNVISEVTVNNAVAPHGSSDANRYLHINGLPLSNTVSIYNRWGDKVYEAYGYDNTSVKFTGQNNNGNDLASGTYFYKIEYTIGGEPQKPITGYLALKQ